MVHLKCVHCGEEIEVESASAPSGVELCPKCNLPNKMLAGDGTRLPAAPLSPTHAPAHAADSVAQPQSQYSLRKGAGMTPAEAQVMADLDKVVFREEPRRADRQVCEAPPAASPITADRPVWRRVVDRMLCGAFGTSEHVLTKLACRLIVCFMFGLLVPLFFLLAPATGLIESKDIDRALGAIPTAGKILVFLAVGALFAVIRGVDFKKECDEMIDRHGNRGDGPAEP